MLTEGRSTLEMHLLLLLLSCSSCQHAAHELHDCLTTWNVHTKAVTWQSKRKQVKNNNNNQKKTNNPDASHVVRMEYLHIYKRQAEQQQQQKKPTK